MSAVSGNHRPCPPDLAATLFTVAVATDMSIAVSADSGWVATLMGRDALGLHAGLRKLALFSYVTISCNNQGTFVCLSQDGFEAAARLLTDPLTRQRLVQTGFTDEDQIAWHTRRFHQSRAEALQFLICAAALSDYETEQALPVVRIGAYARLSLPRAMAAAEDLIARSLLRATADSSHVLLSGGGRDCVAALLHSPDRSASRRHCLPSFYEMKSLLQQERRPYA